MSSDFFIFERRDLRVAVELENRCERRRRRRRDGRRWTKPTFERTTRQRTLGASLHARGEFRGERVRAFLRGAFAAPAASASSSSS